MARLLNVLEALVPTQGGNLAPQATLQTQAPLGHHLRDCPQPPRNFSQASIQSGAPTQTTRNTLGVVCTRNRGRGVGDRDIVNQGQGNAGRGQAKIFAFTRQDAHASNDVVRQPELSNDPLLVATLVGESLLAEYVYRACQIRVDGRDTLVDLIVLDMIDFDILMEMDWLSSCYAIIDCHAKIVKFEIPNEPSFVLKWDRVSDICKVVSFMKDQWLLKKDLLSLSRWSPGNSFFTLRGRAYTLRQLKKHEQNYYAHDLEMIAVVFDLKIWRHYPYGETCKLYNDHKRLKYIFQQRDLNLRQHLWMELLKEYDCSTLYHLGKTNVVANALSRKSMGSLAHIDPTKRLLDEDIHRLEGTDTRFSVGNSEALLVCAQVKSSLVKRTKATQYEDERL
uniref:Uncharacterized protein LOC104211608 n=1 Tax=Nicotiana sylvestris TaxID=4096 RepID=A0A1U7UXV6_NICSY|nr:PREDICTED: uncharacterized protein LOC104211608 [Nicotiana sylvestris]